MPLIYNSQKYTTAEIQHDSCFFFFLFTVFSEFSTPSKIYYSYIAKKKKNLKIGTRRKNINLSFFFRKLEFLATGL